MALSFPHYFPAEFLGPVVRTETEAAIQLTTTLNGLPRPLRRQSVEDAAIAYFSAVAVAFASQACAAARAQHLRADEVAETVEDFCRRLRVHADSELKILVESDVLRVSGFDYALREAEARLKRSEGWLRYLRERADLIDGEKVRAPLHERAAPVEAEKVRGPLAEWKDLEIRFLSEERVQVTTSTFRETRNYAELGFEDRRSGKPIMEWETFTKLAQANGVIEVDRSVRGYNEQSKRLQEIRRVLRKQFGLTGDPVPLLGDHYRTQFRVSHAPSFDY